MTSCGILDFGCIFINEIFGSVTLAAIGSIIIFLIISGKLRLGFELTLALLFPVAILVSLAIGGFTVVYAFATLAVAILVGYLFQKIIGNRY